MAIRYVDDLYPADDPRDGARILRFTHHQQAHYEAVRNGTGAGEISLRGTTADAQAIDPTGLQYVRKRRINTAIVDAGTLSGFDELVVGGYWFEQGDFLALDRKRLKTLKFGGTGTLSYLDREIMWSHSYLDELGFAGTMDPFDRIWRLWNQGDWAGGDFLGAILWRVISEGLAYRVGATYTHRHATPEEFGVEFTDAHDDDKLETAIPFVTLGFDQFEDSSGNAWTVASGEFEAQVGDSLYEVTMRLMEAGLYVELDPDTFELRAWEVANHGRDRTGLAWGANVVRFNPPAAPSTLRSAGNILNDLKRALRPFIKVTSVLAGGGEDTYAVATASATVPWHRFKALDINDTDALQSAADRDITRRNDAGDTVLVRSKVAPDPANGYYLPAEHAKLDDLVTVHSGTDTWDWDEAAYPIAKWSVTSRRTGAPDVFYHLGASYHAGASKEFAGGSGVGRHTHPPNPRLCDSSDVLRGLTELKVSGEFEAPKENANDGDDVSTWGSGDGDADPIGVAGEWWAADLGERHLLGQYRILQNGGTSPDVQNVATEVHILATDDPAAWAALPASGKLNFDPEGWTLLATRTNSLSYNDSGRVSFDPGGGRYVLFRAVSGGTLDWDVETFELWSYEGTSTQAARCNHDHLHPLLSEDGVHYHDAEQIEGASVAVPDLWTSITFPIVAHRGDMNPTDGYPENTIPALREAARRAHGVEFDVIRSADGTWHIIHDTTVDRTTDGTGTVTALTDAYLAARTVDGGHGFVGARHTSLALGIPTLDEGIDVMLPFDPVLYFDLKESTDEAHEALAQYIVDHGLVARSVLLGLTVSGLAAAHAIAPTLEMQIPAVIDDDSQSYAYIDRVLTEQATVTDAAYVQAREPDPVDSYIAADDHYGDDETTYLTNMWERGVRAYLTNDLPGALALRNEIVLGITASSSGALWHPVMAQDPSDSRWYVVVDGSGTAVMAEAP